MPFGMNRETVSGVTTALRARIQSLMEGGKSAGEKVSRFLDTSTGKGVLAAGGGLGGAYLGSGIVGALSPNPMAEGLTDEERLRRLKRKQLLKLLGGLMTGATAGLAAPVVWEQFRKRMNASDAPETVPEEAPEYEESGRPGER